MEYIGFIPHRTLLTKGTPMATYPDLQNKVAILTGAAGALAEAVIQRFQAEGVLLALVDRDQGRLEAKFGGVDPAKCLLVGGVEISDKAKVSGAVEKIAAHFGKIHILVNIAGGYSAGTPVHETDEEVWDSMVNSNAKSVFLMSGAVVPVMLQHSEGGRIINIGATGGLHGGKNSAAYSVSKSAVFRLTESLSAELKDQHITVNAVYPSTIDTPANRSSMPKADFSKWVTPDSMAGVIAFLASEAARDVTGALLPVTGRA
ncbi:MAG: SDR family oxidoreductase [Chloroflexi bacterium]|nr:SDR family oxidoreductase [Chloroflexota bacterium]